MSPFSGTTRDRKDAVANIGGLDIRLIDTAGYDRRQEYSTQIIDQVKRALLQSDVILFIIDGKNGINSVDMDCSNWIRSLMDRELRSRHVIVVSKCIQYLYPVMSQI